MTGQALEDMQEQNSRLIQQLREKDDANFKLMSERIKSNQIARLAREEKEMYIQQVATLTTQVEYRLQHSFTWDNSRWRRRTRWSGSWRRRSGCCRRTLPLSRRSCS